MAPKRESHRYAEASRRQASLEIAVQLLQQGYKFVAGQSNVARLDATSAATDRLNGVMRQTWRDASDMK
jgi:hypothetical protein